MRQERWKEGERAREREKRWRRKAERIHRKVVWWARKEEAAERSTAKMACCVGFGRSSA